MKLSFITDIKKSGKPCAKYIGTKTYIDTGSIKRNIIVSGDDFSFDKKPSRANLCAIVGDVLFAKMQNSVKVIEIDSTNSDFIYSTGFYFFRDERILPAYMKYLFLSPKFNSIRNSKSHGATMSAVNDDDMKGIKVDIPDKIFQAQVVSKLDLLTKILDIETNQLELFDELIKSRFIEMFGETNNKKAMKDLCSIITDGTHQPPKFQKEGIPFIFVSNIIGNQLTYDAEKFISEKTYSELIKRTPIRIGDILLSTVGSYGHPAVVLEDRKFLFQRHIAYLKPKSDIINSFYLHAALLSTDAQRQIEEKVKGIAQKTLNLSEIKTIVIPFPTMDEQMSFAALVEQTGKLKVELQNRIDFYTELLNKKMDEYFNLEVS